MDTTDLARALRTHLDAVPVPPGDVEATRRRGRRLQRGRRVTTGLGAAAAVTATVLAVNGIAGPTTGGGSVDYATTGPLDLSHGLRAYASPGGRIHLGDRVLPSAGLEYLDTDAVATAYGMVFFDRERVRLLQADGTVRALSGPAEFGSSGFHPTAKADAVRPWVAWAEPTDDGADVVVYDLARGTVVNRSPVDCDGGCTDLKVDGLDSGLVFLRTADGTRTWDVASGDYADLAGPDTRVADVRNQVLLHDGPPPTTRLPGWTYVAGAIDAQLTFDGGHVLYWSDRLTPVGDDEPIKLRLPEQATFFAFDTDGSVLAATLGSPAEFYDCVLPSGRCESLGPMTITGGDPMFIGDDM